MEASFVTFVATTAIMTLVIAHDTGQVELDCKVHPCVHGICRGHNNGSYECFCENGYTGYLCETNFDDCVVNPCQNHATCLDQVAGFICVCPVGFTGTACENVLDHCFSQPCRNGGTCQDSEGGFLCLCPPGFTGLDCTTEVTSVCDSRDAQCYNGGTCIEGIGDSFTCSCPSGFEGSRCETNIDGCLSQPCQNNGTCVDQIEGYSCLCPYRWSGMNCELIQALCPSELCSNKGLCLGNETHHACYCVPDYHGLWCQWRYNECLPKPRCKNGGTCVDSVDSYVCMCPPKYTGTNCEIYKNIYTITDAEHTPLISMQSNYENTMSLISDTLIYTSTSPDIDITHSTSRDLGSKPLPDSSSVENFDISSVPTFSQSVILSGDLHSIIPSFSENHEPVSSWLLHFSSDFTKTEFADSTHTYDDSSFPIFLSTIASFELDTIGIQFSSSLAEISSVPYEGTSDFESTIFSKPLTPSSVVTLESGLTTFNLEISSLRSSFSSLISSASVTPTFPSSILVTASYWSPSMESSINSNAGSPYIDWNKTLFSFIENQLVFPTESKWSHSVHSTSTLFGQGSESYGGPSPFYSDISSFVTATSTSVLMSASPRSAWTPTEPPFQDVCASINCKNDGLCHPLNALLEPQPSATNFICLCQLNFEGTYCENLTSTLIKMPSFSGYSYLSYNLTNTLMPHIEENLLVKVAFQTVRENGILFHLDFGDNCLDTFVTGAVERGLAMLRFSCGAHSIISMEEGIRVDDGVRHTVILRSERNSRHLPHDCALAMIKMQWFVLRNETASISCNVSVQLDDWPPLTGQQRDLGTLCQAAQLHVGGVPFNHAVWSELSGLQGCIQEVMINGIYLELLPNATHGLDVHECSSGVICAGNPCYHRGNCRNLSATEIECQCSSKFTGQFCERRRCFYDFCMAGGTCLSLSTSPNEIDQYVCLCPYGYQGLRCEEASSLSKPQFYGSINGYSSYLAFSVPTVDTKSFGLTVTLKCLPEGASQSGLLFFMGQNGIHFWNSEFLAVGLHEGNIYLQYNIGNGINTIKRSFTEIQLPNEPHSVHSLEFGFIKEYIWINLDGSENVSAALESSHNQLFSLQQNFNFYIGGHENYNFSQLPQSLLFNNGFSGCIYDVEVGTANPPTVNTLIKPNFGRNVHQCNKNECDVNPCLNGGTCMNMGATFRCTCPPGWFGPVCNHQFNSCQSGNHRCSHWSVCIVQLDGYSCSCPLGWTGQYCDEVLSNLTIPYFNGRDSYLSFSPQNVRHEMSVLMEIQPLSEDAVLFYAASQLNEGAEDFVCISLNKGFVEFRYNLGRGAFSVAVLRSRTQVKADHNRWYVIEASRSGNMGQLTLDSTDKVIGESSSGMVSLDTSTDFFLGGLPDMEFIVRTAVETVPIPYYGCVRRFIVNDRAYHLDFEEATRGLNIFNCNSSDLCNAQTCQNKGICVMGNNSNYHCNCLYPYTGRNCQEFLQCQIHACQNGAVCIPSEKEDSEALPYSCLCLLGWSGQYCDKAIRITEAQFGSNSYVFVVDDTYPTADRARNRFAFTFKSQNKNGLILWTGIEPNGDDDYFGAGLEDGHLKVVWNVGWFSRSQVTSFSGGLTDSNWHNVVINREKQKVVLTVDGVSVDATSPGNFTELNTLGAYYLGGFPLGKNISIWSNGHFHNSYQGCLKDVRLSHTDSQVIDFMMAENGMNIEQCE